MKRSGYLSKVWESVFLFRNRVYSVMVRSRKMDTSPKSHAVIICKNGLLHKPYKNCCGIRKWQRVVLTLICSRSYFPDRRGLRDLFHTLILTGPRSRKRNPTIATSTAKSVRPSSLHLNSCAGIPMIRFGGFLNTSQYAVRQAHVSFMEIRVRWNYRMESTWFSRLPLTSA